jgi:hypothetical protein
MRRWLAVLLLCLVGAYLAATGSDDCGGSRDDTCAPVCHLLCADGCAAAPMPTPPVAPPADPLPRPRFQQSPAVQPLIRAVEPEQTPPRG